MIQDLVAGTSDCESLMDRPRTLMAIEHMGDASTALDGIPEVWQINSDQVRLYAVDGKPLELGRGGFGIVLHGTVHKEDAAIKTIRDRDRANQAALLNEITIMDRAKSDYIVRFLGFSVCRDGLLLAMEFMKNGTLFEALARSDDFQWYGR